MNLNIENQTRDGAVAGPYITTDTPTPTLMVQNMFTVNKKTGFSNIETLTSASISLIICLICVYSMRYYLILDQKIKYLKTYNNFLLEINNQVLLKNLPLTKLNFNKINKKLPATITITKPYGKDSRLNKISIQPHEKKNIYKAITLFKIEDPNI